MSDELMTCPKCSLEQPKDVYCAGCGINIKELENKPLSKLKSHHLTLIGFLCLGLIFLSYNLLTSHPQSSRSKFEREVKTNWKTLSRPQKKDTKENINSQNLSQALTQTTSLEKESKTEEVVEEALTLSPENKDQEKKPTSPSSEKPPLSARIKLLEISHEALVGVLKDNLNLDREENTDSLLGQIFLPSSKDLFDNPKAGVTSFLDETKELNSDQTISLSNDTLFIKTTKDSESITFSFSYEVEGESFNTITIAFDSEQRNKNLLIPYFILNEDTTNPTKWAVLFLTLN